jgi:hypothetical protein
MPAARTLAHIDPATVRRTGITCTPWRPQIVSATVLHIFLDNSANVLSSSGPAGGGLGCRRHHLD